MYKQTKTKKYKDNKHKMQTNQTKEQTANKNTNNKQKVQTSHTKI